MLKYFWLFYGKVINFFRSLDSFILSAFTLIAIFLMFVCTFILVIFTATQVTETTGGMPLFKDTSDWILTKSGFTLASISKEEYLSILGSFTGVIAVLVTLWFSIVTTIRYFNYKKNLKKYALIKKEPVYADGIDDLKVMLRYYKSADQVTVFSGDFSWLHLNAELNKQILRLAKEQKISFVSYKSKDVVKNAIDNEVTFSTLENLFHFDSKMKIKCSLVHVRQNRMFLYKVDKSLDGGDRDICIISGRNDAEYLLETLSSLCVNFEPI